MKKLLLLIIVSLVLAGSASARLDWAPTSLDPNEVIEVGNWNVDTNWNAVNQTAPAAVPTAIDEVQIGIDSAPCLIDSDTNAVCLRMKGGDNGDLVDGVSVLTIKGSLTTYTTDSWSSAAYNRPGIINVEKDAVFDNGYRIGVGLVGSTNPTVPSYLNVNGGDVFITQNLQIGTAGTLIPFTGHIGIVKVNSGTLETGNWQWRDTTGVWSFIDVRHGTLIVNADVTSEIPALETSGSLTAYGGAGTLVYGYANGQTTITATGDPHGYSPAMDALVTIPVSEQTPLSWNNLEPSPVWIEVYFGTNVDAMVLIDSGQDKTSAVADIPTAQEYIWRVDTLLDNPATEPDPNMIEGETMYFKATSDEVPAVVVDTLPTATWIAEPVDLNITVTNDTPEDNVFLWESSDPNTTFIPNNTVEDPTVSVDYQAGTVTLTVTVGDQNPLGLTATGITTIFVASTPCTAARAGNGMNLAGDHPADINGDCSPDLADFAVIAGDWQADYAITETTPIP